MSKDLIRKGIDALQASGVRSTADVNPAAKLAEMAGLNTSLQTIKETRHAAKTLRDRLVHVRTSLQKDIAAKEARIRREHDEMGWLEGDRPGHRIDQLGPNRRRVMRDAALNKMRKAIKSNVTDELAIARQNLVEQEKKLKLLDAAWASPLTVLNRTTLKSQDRATAQANLNGAGVHSVNTAAEEAVRTGDKAVAAAVTMAIDHLPKEQRSLLKFSREEIAASVIFDEFSAASEQLVMTEYLLEMSKDLTDEIDHGSIDPDRKIRTGTIKRELAAKLGKTEADIDDEGNTENE